MEIIDWIVLLGTLTAIVGYGTWKTRKNKNIEGFLKGDNQMKWWTIGLSIMATQASAITFLSTPGQAYENGMGFVQFYFGLPIAMVIISTVFIPIYYKLNVFTAYEYLEKRFDLNIRLFTAFLFLVSRGLAAGITIYAPAIVLSSLLGWDLTIMNILVGALVIVYTVSGGTRAVSLTQKWQMAIIMGGMFVAFFITFSYLPDQIGFTEAVDIAGIMGKMEVIDTTIDLENRYTLLTGLIGGLFLSLSYFGTDQSQVQRYLGGKSIAESRLGLMFNGLLKVPMQFFILFVGIMVFVFFQFNQPPAFFNAPGLEKAKASSYSAEINQLETNYQNLYVAKEKALTNYVNANEEEKQQFKEEAVTLYQQSQEVRSELKSVIKKAAPDVETKDHDYVFLSFVLGYMPQGIIGLLLAVILSAAMSSTAGELNALASTTMVDYYKRIVKSDGDEKSDLRISRLLTVIWGLLAIGIALVANLFDNLIQLVNILGSLFYGTILGIFIVAFFLKYVKGRAVLIGGIVGEITVLTLHFLTVYKLIDIGYLWYNVIGCLVVVGISLLVQLALGKK